MVGVAPPLLPNSQFILFILLNTALKHRASCLNILPPLQIILRQMHSEGSIQAIHPLQGAPLVAAPRTLHRVLHGHVHVR